MMRKRVRQKTPFCRAIITRPSQQKVFFPGSFSHFRTFRVIITADMLSLLQCFIIILISCETDTRISQQNSGCHLTFRKHCFEKCRSHIIIVCWSTLWAPGCGVRSWSQTSHLPLSVWGNLKKSPSLRQMFPAVIRPRWLLHPEIGP